ncbi:hypothetical protein Bhyg_05902 [Pseudolycoriella hygida]|uniref:Uncharacterized protein n=1 Tax=Pseudolycoriella hygida TaxID=35572 RepID=A0A9Q0MZU4_9DIPT|nr:hypothetical protein Bhyg_05902 [Pseudolycoriella hygida]
MSSLSKMENVILGKVKRYIKKLLFLGG